MARTDRRQAPADSRSGGRTTRMRLQTRRSGGQEVLTRSSQWRSVRGDAYTLCGVPATTKKTQKNHNLLLRTCSVAPRTDARTAAGKRWRKLDEHSQNARTLRFVSRSVYSGPAWPAVKESAVNFTSELLSRHSCRGLSSPSDPKTLRSCLG